MDFDNLLCDKNILVVDDEQDVLDSLCDLLNRCKIDTATNFDAAKQLLESNCYDLAILDIMGVDGYALLEIANMKKIPAIMLTAHALSEANMLKSAEAGAAYYAPKEELINIKEIVWEVFDALENKKSTWKKMFERLTGFYDRKFNGPDWRTNQADFWDKKFKQYKDRGY